MIARIGSNLGFCRARAFVTIDYLHLLRQLPGLYLLLEPRPPFRIVDASDAYLAATYKVREQVAGVPLFEAFPDNPADRDASGVANLRASLETVIATGKTHTMAEQRYAVARADGRFEERWWTPVNSPYFDAQGRLAIIVHRVEDATHSATREQAFRATEVLESISEGFFTLDRDYCFAYVNREAERILEKSRGELLGKLVWDVYPDLEVSEFGHAYREVMERREPAVLTSFYEGDQRWYEVHAYPAPRGIAVYFRDVTQTRHAQDELRRLADESDRQRRIYETVVNNTPDLMYIFGPDHRFTYANGPLLAIWGMTLEQAMGKSMREIGYPEWEAEMHDREIDQVIATGKPIQGEVPFEGATGLRYWDYIFAPIIGRDGSVVAVAGTARDTTERRAAEDEIASQARRLREADRAKDEFIATLSHELRNPLSPLRNALALLGARSGGDANTVRLVSTMERQVNHLVRLVDDLLEISRVTRGDFALRRERTPLASIVRNALENCGPVLQARGHTMNITQPAAPIWVEADPVRLAQVIGNLIDNAAKYTAPGGVIDVQVRHEDGFGVVSVRDNGPGISPDALQRVFEMFNRGDRHGVQGEGGLGIGLALAKRLVRMHDGDIQATSAGLGKGSEFTVRVPVADASAGDEAPHAAAGPIGRKRILVVDDNRDAAETLGLVLQGLGAEVHVAHDGKAAIEAFPRFQPSAVVLDIGMPEMDGYEVARRLRDLSPGRPVSLIALTGWGQEDDRSRARDAGFDHHIVKPADLHELQQLLASI